MKTLILALFAAMLGIAAANASPIGPAPAPTQLDTSWTNG
jgi:hypothetical protein